MAHWQVHLEWDTLVLVHCSFEIGGWWVGNGMGSGNLYGLQEWVSAGMGTGTDFTTCDPQNKFKNITFGPELSRL